MLRDLQISQNLVPVVDMAAVMNSESLLSGSITNIELAGSVMEGLMDTGDSLILTSWRHYYCSTGSLHDSDIDLARKCLSLAPADTVREVQDCFDLIAALQSLADFVLGDGYSGHTLQGVSTQVVGHPVDDIYYAIFI